MTFRRILALAVIAIAAPIVSHAQAGNPCGPGGTVTYINGGPNYTCTFNSPSAPEIGTSSSIGGVAVLLGGAIMLRGRKRKVSLAAHVA